MKNPNQQQQEMARKQQEAFQKQQEQLHHRQMQAAWMDQQKAKQIKAEQAKPGGPALPLSFESQQKFNKVQLEVAGLKEELKKGRLSVDQVKERLKELIIQDEAGVNWTVGFETWGWYRYDGTSWIPGDPFRPASQNLPDIPSSKAKSHPISAIFWFLVFLVITIFLGGIISDWFVNNHISNSEPTTWLIAGIIWIIGLIISIRLARSIWRGH